MMPNSLKGMSPSFHLKAVFLKGLRQTKLGFKYYRGFQGLVDLSYDMNLTNLFNGRMQDGLSKQGLLFI
jgi:hypothetical protein